jgi:hypothetical protein
VPSIHQPHRGRAIAALPEDVALKIAVEVVGLHNNVVDDLKAPAREAADIAITGIVVDVKAPRRVVERSATKS